MKKKILIKESELTRLVEETINTRIDGKQLRLDLENQGPLVELIGEKYEEILRKIQVLYEEFTDADFLGYDEETDFYEDLGRIYDEEIFNVAKYLHKIPTGVGSEVVEKFNQLEDDIIDCLEIHREYQKVKQDLDTSFNQLRKFFPEA